MKAFIINKADAKDRLSHFRAQNFQAERVEPVSLDNPELISCYIPSDKDETKRKREISNILTFRDIIQSVRSERCFLRLEDDVEFIQRPEPVLELIQTLPDDFGLCFLGAYFRPTGGRLIRYNNSFLEFKSNIKTWGLHAVVIGHAAYDALSDVQSILKDKCLDMYISNNILPKYRCFTAYPTVAIQSERFITKSIHGIKFDKRMYLNSEKNIQNMLKK